MNIWLKIFLTCVVSHKVQMKRLVVNTTCLELAKPSSQQFRLPCSQYNYHCLLDETFTKEFEVCREWKWIPKGQCAYFNTYGEGNIDGRPCVNSANLVCPTWQYSSAQTTKYTACYMKETTSTMEPRTRILPVSSTESSDGGISTFPKSETNDKQRTIWPLPIAFVILISVIIFAAISYFGRLKCFQRLRKVISEKKEEDNEDLTDVYSNTDESTPITEPPIVKSDNEEENVKDSEDESTYTTESLQRKPPPTDQRMESINEKENGEESIDLFCDTVETEEALPTDAQNGELCNQLLNLLRNEGRNLSQEVMATVIARIFGKSAKDLVADETIKIKVTEELYETYYHILKDSLEREEPIHASYNLLRIILGKEHHSNSGWGNPSTVKDIGIGDDVKRLYKIQTIVQGISNAVTVSVDDYIRLLDTMIEALIRLDPDAVFKEDYKLLSYKLESIKKPNLTQTMSKKKFRILDNLVIDKK